VRIIERSNIDLEKWDKLVEASAGSSVFSCSWYLDAVAENWCVIVDETYSMGMALPYSKRMGVEILYTPIFLRYVEWFGSKADWFKAGHLIRERFRIIELSIKEPMLGEGYEEFVYQRTQKSEERKVGSQAKRSLQKAVKSSLSIEENAGYDLIFNSICSELKSKIQGIDDVSVSRLEELIKNAWEKGVLRSFHVVNDEVEGGILCIENKSSLLYLKGAVDEQTKKNGGMYLAMDSAINYSRENGLDFDFGGSRVEGVKKFNHNLGGQDTVYYAYVINNGPGWFNFARRLKNRWSKK
jgi:hypothetical protein